ncbi:transposon Tf2-11 polyprotein [Trichonephila clavipes]|nr:transposon Tf2-11 polyprotein [Trichonephila clavipes]
MGNLSKERVRENFPFDCNGIDFIGPFWIKSNKQRKSSLYKTYASIFVGFVTKAVHFELVSGLTTLGFIASLKRFIARRGRPSLIFSDNGKTFIGANAELNRLHKLVINPDPELADFFVDENINWKFLPPRAPNFGGLWEAGVKSLKFHFKREAGNSRFTYEEFLTIMTQIEGILISRPLTPLSTDIDDLIESISEIDYDKIADAQVDNEELNKLRLKPSLNFKQYPPDSGKLLWWDISTANIRPFIPQPLRMHMFQKIHILAHLGVKPTVKQISSRFIWLNIRKDVNQWAKYYIQCQKNKINRHTHSQIGTFQEVDDRFSVIHVDIIGPFPVSEGKGKTNCLTCIDRFTCWIEVVPLSNITVEMVAGEFFNHWISRFRMPYRVITDQGTPFRSELFKNIGVIWGFKILPTVLLGLRSALRSDTNYTIAQMVYGQTIRLPGEFFDKPKNVLDTDTFAKELQKP